MKHIDVTVPFDARPATYPTNTPFTFEPITGLARDASSNRVLAAHERAYRHTRALEPTLIA
jgi:kynurenine formamidase